MHTVRIPSYAPVALPVRFPPPSAPRVVAASVAEERGPRFGSPTWRAFKIIAMLVGISASVAVSLVGAADVVLRDYELPTLAAPLRLHVPPPRPTAARVDLFVEHIGDDCASIALEASRTCEDVLCLTTASVELRACLARPEEEARACADVPDTTSATADAWWIDARCSGEQRRNYSDCVRLMSVVVDHCAVVQANDEGAR